MTLLELYLTIGLPLLLVGIGWGAVWLQDAQSRRDDQREARARAAAK